MVHLYECPEQRFMPSFLLNTINYCMFIGQRNINFSYLLVLNIFSRCTSIRNINFSYLLVLSIFSRCTSIRNNNFSYMLVIYIFLGCKRNNIFSYLLVVCIFSGFHIMISCSCFMVAKFYSCLNCIGLSF